MSNSYSNSYDTGVVPSIERDTNNTTAPGLDNAKNAVINSEYPSSLAHFHITNHQRLDATAAANAVKNHPITQNITNGPVAENVKDQSAKTQADFSSLAASRTTPTTTTATGQQLTHYHSFFSRLLSWEHPRASGIAYGSIVTFIFAARYLNILSYGFKLTYLTLLVTVLAEVAGKTLLGKGLTSQIRPRKYYTIRKDSLDRLTGDVHELINFFVIESQRIVFAENVFASGVAFLGAFISYYLIKIVPFWGLTLLSTTLLFLTPLIYKTNKEVIDAQLTNISNIANQQTEQVKQLASHHASRAAETTKSYAADYSTKAQEIIGNARGRSSSPATEKKPFDKTASATSFDKTTSATPSTTSTYKNDDFPVAPKQDFKSSPLGTTNDFKPTPLGTTNDFKPTPLGTTNDGFQSSSLGSTTEEFKLPPLDKSEPLISA